MVISGEIFWCKVATHPPLASNQLNLFVRREEYRFKAKMAKEPSNQTSVFLSI